MTGTKLCVTVGSRLRAERESVVCWPVMTKR